jgi:hypothetical protein
MTDELAKRLKLIASKLMGRMVVDGVEVNATCDQAADRIEALIEAGDRLAGFGDHYNECDWADRERCECGLTEALNTWHNLQER